MTSKVIQQIIEQLKDSSYPPIILLDGDWGIGKTHLINKELKELLESETEEFGDFYYISAFGIQNVSEFQDQVVSLYMSNQEKSSEYIKGVTSFSSKLAQMCGANTSEAGIIQGVISGTTGFLRQKAIENMKNFTLVIDDLERLTNEKLIAEIMGTCLRFAEHNKIKVIAIANVTAFKDKTKVEKSFSDVIKLTRTSEELLNIITDNNNQMPDSIKKTFFDTIEQAQKDHLNINNLRVLQRAINRVIKLTNKISYIEGIDQNLITKKLTKHIVFLTLYSYTNKLDMDDVKSIVENKQKWLSYSITETIMAQNFDNSKLKKEEFPELNEDEKRQSELFEQLRSFLNGLPSIALIEYCFTNLVPELNDREFIEQFELPRLATLLDIFKFGSFYNFDSEEEFNDGVNQLKNILFNTDNVNLSDWMLYCDKYLYMNELGYFEGTNISELTKELEVRILKEGVIDLDTAYSAFLNEKGYLSHGIKSDSFYSATDELIQRSKSNFNASIMDDFLKNWKQTFDKHRNLIKNEAQPFFHNIDCKKFAEAITQWTTMEIAEFRDFMRERYKPYNQLNYDALELPTLELLYQKLDLKRESISGKLKKGILKELVQELKDITTTIKNRKKVIQHD